LAGGIAHDFNNILTALLGYSNLLKLKIGNDQVLNNYVDQILISSEKAANLTKSLLAFSRKQIIDPKPVDLNQIVRGIEKLLRRLIGEDIEFKTILDDRELAIMADSGQIEQILINLSSNASDAMPGGGIFTIQTEHIELRESGSGLPEHLVPGEYALITASDTGKGMDEKTKQRIFEPFFTTKEVGKGTGMGLSIVHGIVAGYGGFVEVESELSKGSSFFVHLPQTDDPGQGEEESCLIGSGGETILLIDDDEVVLEMTRVMIEMLGYTVVSKKDWVDALKLLGENPHGYDLVILNQAMACLKGKELSRQLLEIRPDLPIVLCMSHGTPPTGMEYWEPGIAELAYKPLAIEDLSALIRNSLGKR
ncbi:MAG TPA: hypothetical protein DDY32_00085, partial [Desulfobulbaceae bacterium]|nr:hypothetical protein [Desulfobulbaceae bacterium]